ncbi:cAMP-binding domain of CRP or a regulatory subunit of cAMP-dependent protein kinases [Methylobacterium phyllostachyos]|uniref:cAMP-binding domain of CRP or a regulatory subunit of cAMP-dependent protein kinases n=1 Tax=Methylobacterium phyllostachyos TaxID=582672 RepID=A0A1H0KWM3_9HYPH|nr:Crp/Fnr family transcriptional regulator [Methylobacterium phyllostachyos]SDO60182.1 cAMP-binding domain of CRP or a regulatory subunit of cAMP-dependent protein kinases [Methylobacterium phyllostachyos]
MNSAPDQPALSMLIRKLESAATLSDAERQAVWRLPTRIHTLDARKNIVSEGDQPTHCCLILDGWACRYVMLREGKRQILSFHIPGDIPDLQSLHIPTIDHSLATLTKVVVAIIPHESLRELTARHPGLAAAFWRDTLLDAAVLREWLISTGQRLAFEHVAHLFCELYLRLRSVGLAEDHRCPMPITQTDIADALGLTPVHINRVLQEMRGRTLITLQGRMLVIKAWDELLRISEFDPTYLQLERRPDDPTPTTRARWNGQLRHQRPVGLR